MFLGVSYKTKQFFFVLIKLSIVVGALYFIYNKVVENENVKFYDFISLLTEKQLFSIKHIGLLLGLTCINWWSEILKWKVLAGVIKPISFSNATEQSLGGLTASLITPNRIGDFGAKAMHYTKEYRKKILLLNLLGHFWQMLVTTILGCIGLLIFINTYPIDVDYYKVMRFAVIVAAVALLSVLGVKQNTFTIKGFSLNRIFSYLKTIPSSIHSKTFILSLFRYIVFSFQFYYLLVVFGIDISYYNAMVVITCLYFLASIIPTITLFDVVIKGSVALYLFGFLEVESFTILCITLLMWLLNFALPSIAGSYYVLKFKLPKTEE